MNKDFLEKIKNIDNLFKNESLNKKNYKIKLSKESRAYINSLKKMNYSSSYIAKLLSNIRKLFSKEHLIMAYLKLSRDEYNEIKAKNTKNINKRNNNKQSINKLEIIKIATELLKTERFEHIYIGLLISSGRRVTELVAGSFLDTKDEVLFSGQLKTKSKVLKEYSIPLVVEKELFFKSLNKLTSSSKFKELKAKYSEGKLPDYYIPKMLEGELYKIFDSKFSLSDLRAMYTTLILDREGYYNSSKTEDFLTRIVEILGHSNTESASNNYRDFALSKEKTILEFNKKILYIRQNRAVKLKSKFLTYKKLEKPNTDNKEKLWEWAFFKSLSKIDLFNIIEIKSEFRKVLRDEFKVKVEQKSFEINMFLSKYIKKVENVTLSVKRKTKSFNNDKKKEIIKHTLLPKLLSYEKYKGKTKEENEKIYSFILIKLFVNKEKYSKILSFNFLKEKFNALSESRFLNLQKIISDNIDLIKMSLLENSK